MRIGATAKPSLEGQEIERIEIMSLWLENRYWNLTNTTWTFKKISSKFMETDCGKTKITEEVKRRFV